MRTTILSAAMLAALLALGGGPALAQSSGDDTIFGSQLMTEQERMEHRARMQSAQTEAEREAIRREHHDEMVKRAQERGVTLPDEPPMRGGGQDMGQGQGMGQGGGMGPGSGMGQGGGRRGN